LAAAAWNLSGPGWLQSKVLTAAANGGGFGGLLAGQVEKVAPGHFLGTNFALCFLILLSLLLFDW